MRAVPRTTTTSIKRGDTAPALAVNLLDGDNPVDLAGVQEVRVQARRGRTQAIDAPAAVDPSVRGRVVYSWAESDTAEVGDLQMEFKVTWADGSRQTFPSAGFLVVHVVEDIL